MNRGNGTPIRTGIYGVHVINTIMSKVELSVSISSGIHLVIFLGRRFIIRIDMIGHWNRALGLRVRVVIVAKGKWELL